jgi:hypothetical protein
MWVRNLSGGWARYGARAGRGVGVS